MSAKLEVNNWPEVALASIVRGSGYAIPSRLIPNSHFESYLDTSDEWIRSRTGIQERYWLADDESINDLTEKAARAAIADAGLEVSDIDGIVLGTVTPEDLFPSAACRLQGRLGIQNAFAFDLNAVCSGFIYALTNADALIRSGACKNVLVLGADVFSRILDLKDRSTCILFGDGAGALVLSRAEGVGESSTYCEPVKGSSEKIRGVYKAILRADGSQGDMLLAGGGPGCHPQAKANAAMQMAGREVFKTAVRAFSEINKQVLAAVGLNSSQVDYFITHQANERIISAIAKDIHAPVEKVLMNVQRYGNTSAGSIPILLAESAEKGIVKKGDLLLLSAFGGGVTWGAVLLRW